MIITLFFKYENDLVSQNEKNEISRNQLTIPITNGANTAPILANKVHLAI